MTTLRAAILVVSTTAAQDPSTDAAAATLSSVFDVDGDGKWKVVATKIVGDVEADIRQAVLDWTDGDDGMHLVVTTGGTGFSASDVTPEAVSGLLDKTAPGLVHGMLAASLKVTPFAVMARPVAGVRKKTILLTLPGSPKGARENLQAVIKMLPHACVLAAGMDSRALHAGTAQSNKTPQGERDGGAALVGGRDHDHSHGHGHGHDHGHSHTHGHGHGLVRHGPPPNALSNDPSLGPSQRSRASPYPMISVEEALARIEQHTPGPVVETRAVSEDLVGYVLAEDVYAPEEVPAFRASIVDGYAVVVPEEGGDVSGVFPVVAVAHAEAEEARTLQPGEIGRITTGAPLPEGANAVVMVESTVLKTTRPSGEDGEDGRGEEEATVAIQATGVRPGDNVRAVGSDTAKGALVMERGERVTAVGGELGLLASVGVRSVKVWRRPVVGVLSTGNEIVSASQEGGLRPGEVRDANRPALLAAARGRGFVVVDLGIAPDRPAALEQRMRDSLRAVDVVLTTGGVSMGELDLLKPTIERALGGTIHFGRVAMKPGKPTTFATVAINDVGGQRAPRTIFSLPGNPASALVTFHLFVLPSLHRIAGERPRGLPRVSVVLAHDFALDRERPEYHRAVVRATADGRLAATSTGGQRSSKVGSMRSANALLCMPSGAEPLRAGARVDALLMGDVGEAS